MGKLLRKPKLTHRRPSHWCPCFSYLAIMCVQTYRRLLTIGVAMVGPCGGCHFLGHGPNGSLGLLLPCSRRVSRV